MLINLDTLGSSEVLNNKFDICVVGSGPAGMSLALRLASKNIKVLLLEAGELEYTARSQSTYKGTNVGLDYFPSETSRMRFFGGSSNHWGGWCKEMNAADFEIHDHIEHSGWPIKKTDLDPYFEETKKILDIETPNVPDYLLLNKVDKNLKNIDFDFSTPVTLFGQKYLDEVKTSKNITCVLNASVVDISLDKDKKTVSNLVISSYSKVKYQVNSGSYVLCMGGIENPRALLNANKQLTNGVGNDNDLVGRFFMEHPHFEVADVLINYEHADYRQFVGKHHLPIAFYEPTTRFRKEQKVLNFGLRFEHPNFNPRKSISFKKRLKRQICEIDSLYSLVKSLKESYRCNKFDAVIRVASEQSPNPESRIKLSDKVDVFGQRSLEIDWQLNELDKHSLRQAGIEAGKIMAKSDLGRIRLRDWVLDQSLQFPDTSQDEVGGYHHMGTTRMAETASHGVVDKDMKVFGVNNLYIGGSSVFSTSGHANPTFTIVQLSLKLADHLTEKIKNA